MIKKGALSYRYAHIANFAICLLGIITILIGYPAFGNPILASGIVLMLSSLLGTDVVSRLKDLFDFKEEMHKNGLRAVYIGVPNLTDEKIERSKTIEILFNTGTHFFRAKHNQILSAIESGCDVTIIISDPLNTLWSQTDLCKSLYPKPIEPDIPKEVEGILAALKDLKTELEQKKASARGSLMVRHYKGVPTGSLLIIDGLFLRHTPYLPYSGSENAPTFEFIESENRKIFGSFMKSFKYALQESEMPKENLDFGKAKSRI